MTMEKLETGMVIELRDGSKFLVLMGNFNTDSYGKQDLMFINYDTFLLKEDYNNDLTEKNSKEYDIVKIYSPNISGFEFLLTDCDENTLIWESESMIEYKNMKQEYLELNQKLKQLKKNMTIWKNKNL